MSNNQKRRGAPLKKKVVQNQNKPVKQVKKNVTTYRKRADGGRKLSATQKLSWDLSGRKKSGNKRNYRRVAGKDQNREVERVPYNRPDGLEGVSKVSYGLKDSFLNPNEYKIVVPQMPSVQTIDINIPLYQRSLTKIAAVSAFIAMGMGIGVDETITLMDGQSVGTLWFYSTCIAYDLYLAMSGSYSLFDSAPRWYWDLRCGVSPTSRGGFAFQFVVPDLFFGTGGLYPTGFPLVIDDLNSNTLSWVVSAGANAGLETVNPLISLGDITDSASVVCNTIWTSMSNLSESTKIIPNPYEENPYTKSVAAFMAYLPENPVDTVNDRWSTFSLEVPVSKWEEWLGFLGLSFFTDGLDEAGNIYTRTGKHTMKEYQYADYLGDRILCGKVGKVPTEYLRKKQISLEWIAGALITQLVNADAFYNEKAGTNSINNATWDRSVLYNLPMGYLLLALMAIFRKWQMLNAAYFDNPDSLAYSLTGRKFYVGAASVIELTSRFEKEFLSDMTPTCQKSGIGNFKTVPVIVAYGNFAMDPTNNGSGVVPFNDLTGIVNMMYQTATPAIQYIVAANDHGLFPYFNVDDLSKANFSGSQIAIGEQAITDAFSVLQGNLDCGIASANINESTLTYYTLLMNLPTDLSREALEKRKRFKISIQRKDMEAIGNWTLTYGASFRQLHNKYAFSNDLISYDLSRGLCVSFQKPAFHAAIYKEPNFFVYDALEMVLFSNNVINGAKIFAHPIATNGGNETNEMIKTFTSQNIGGGFGSMAKMFLSNIPLVGPLLGDLAENLLDG